MKKLVILMLTSVLVFVTVACGESNKNNVTDKAGCLSAEEIGELSEKLYEIGESYDFEAAIYIEQKMSGHDCESTAERIYTDNGYGSGENKDGILLYFCVSSGEHHLVTRGRAADVFDSDGLAYIESSMQSHIDKHDYYKALSVYCDTTNELLEMYKGDSENTAKNNYVYIAILIVAAVLLLCIISFSVRGGIKKSKKDIKKKAENGQ